MAVPTTMTSDSRRGREKDKRSAARRKDSNALPQAKKTSNDSASPSLNPKHTHGPNSNLTEGSTLGHHYIESRGTSRTASESSASLLDEPLLAAKAPPSRKPQPSRTGNGRASSRQENDAIASGKAQIPKSARSHHFHPCRSSTATASTVPLSSDGGSSGEVAGEAGREEGCSPPIVRPLSRAPDKKVIHEVPPLRPYQQSFKEISAPKEGSTMKINDAQEVSNPTMPQEQKYHEDWGMLWESSGGHREESEQIPRDANDQSGNTLQQKHLAPLSTHENGFLGRNVSDTGDDFSCRAEQSFYSGGAEQDSEMSNFLKSPPSGPDVGDVSVSSADWSAAVTRGSMSAVSNKTKTAMKVRGDAIRKSPGVMPHKNTKSGHTHCSDVASGIATQGKEADKVPELGNMVSRFHLKMQHNITNENDKIEKNIQESKRTFVSDMTGINESKRTIASDMAGSAQAPASIFIHESKRTIVSDMAGSAATSWREKHNTATAKGMHDPENHADMPKAISMGSKKKHNSIHSISKVLTHSNTAEGCSSLVSCASAAAGSTASSLGDANDVFAGKSAEKRNDDGWEQSLLVQTDPNISTRRAPQPSITCDMDQSTAASFGTQKSYVSWADNDRSEKVKTFTAMKQSRMAYEDEWKQAMKKGIPELGESSTFSQGSNTDTNGKSETKLLEKCNDNGVGNSSPEMASGEVKIKMISELTDTHREQGAGKDFCPRPEDFLRHFKGAIEQEAGTERGGRNRNFMHATEANSSPQKDQAHWETTKLRRKPRWGRRGKQTPQPKELVCDSMSQVSGISDMVDSTATSWKEQQSLTS